MMPQKLMTMNAGRGDSIRFRTMMTLIFGMLLLAAAVTANAGGFHLELAYCDLQAGPLTTTPDGGVPLPDGCVGQVILHRTDSPIPVPNADGSPGGEDELLYMPGGVQRQLAMGSFRLNGEEDLQAAGYFLIDGALEGKTLPEYPVYVRIWNAADIAEATHYYDTPLYRIMHGTQQMNFSREKLTMHPLDGVLGNSAEGAAVAGEFNVLASYPNPFNAEANLTYSLQQPAHVAIHLYDVQGRRTAELAAGAEGAGEHSLHFTAGDLPTGTYFAVLNINGANVSTRRMLLLK